MPQARTVRAAKDQGRSPLSLPQCVGAVKLDPISLVYGLWGARPQSAALDASEIATGSAGRRL